MKSGQSPVCVLALAVVLAAPASAQRPMTFLDAQNMRQVAGHDISPDGKSMLYTLSTPDWQSGAPSVRHLPGVDRPRPVDHSAAHVHEGQERDESAWSRDGRFIAFLSDRDATAAAAVEQPVVAARDVAGAAGGEAAPAISFSSCALDGGEAKRITDAREGVSNFSFTKDGKSIVYHVGSQPTTSRSTPSR